VALRGGSSNFDAADRLRRLAQELPALLRRRLHRTKTKKHWQMQRRLKPEQIKRLMAEYEAGDNMLHLAKRWRLHRTTVSDHLRRAGVPVRHRGIPVERLDEVVSLYYEGWSCLRIAKYFGCNAETVRQALIRSGTTLRKRWDQ